MALPPKITRSLQRATCDKIALDRCFLRLLFRFRQVARLLEEIDFPEELVVNSSPRRLLEELKLHNKPVVERIGGTL